jgi:hypothetical protein
LNEQLYTFSRVAEADAAPTESQLEVLKLLDGRLEEQLKNWAQIKSEDVPKVNELIKQADIPALSVAPVATPSPTPSAAPVESATPSPSPAGTGSALNVSAQEVTADGFPLQTELKESNSSATTAEKTPPL